jgi:hypothetical protein
MGLNRFTLMEAHQTVNSGLNTILIAAAVVLAPFCIFLVGVSVYLDISKIYGGIILTLGAILFFAGLIGFSTKFMSDTLSIGLNLNSKARGDLPHEIEMMNFKDTVMVGFNAITVVSLIVVISVMFLFIGGQFSEIQATSFECANGELIPMDTVEDGNYDCVEYTDRANGTSLYDVTGEDEVLGAYNANVTPSIVKVFINVSYLISGLVMISGLIGMSMKIFADSISIGLTLYENAPSRHSVNEEE